MWPPEAANQLRLRGHDVIGVAERPDLRGKPDHSRFSSAGFSLTMAQRASGEKYRVPDQRRAGTGRTGGSFLVSPLGLASARSKPVIASTRPATSNTRFRVLPLV